MRDRIRDGLGVSAMAERQKVREIEERKQATVEGFGLSLADAQLVKCARCGIEIDASRCRKCGYQPSARLAVVLYFLLVVLPATLIAGNLIRADIGGLSPFQLMDHCVGLACLGAAVLVTLWCVVLWRRGRR
jgi:hypothetical protein